MFGAGVIGSVYAGRLHDAGHDVTLFARGDRLAALRDHGLVLEDAHTGRRTVRRLPLLPTLNEAISFDAIVVAVRREQFADATAALARSPITGDVVLFGNAAGTTQQFTSMLGPRALIGFPAAGGVGDGEVIRYVLIRQQKTMLAEPGGMITTRLHTLADALKRSGFATTLSTDGDGWLTAHAAFVVPIALALYRVGVDPTRLAADPATIRLMVRATRQAFLALRGAGNRQVPRNLRALYLYAPEWLAVAYWRRTMASPNGELWFGAHCREAREEMIGLADVVRDACAVSQHRTPELAELLGSSDR